MQTRITVNGQEFRSIEEMPADVRREYERVMGMVGTDKDRNGLPDIFEGRSKAPIGRAGKTDMFTTVTTTSTQLNLNGQEFSRLEDLPPEVREMIGADKRFAHASIGIEKTSETDGGGFTIHVTWSTLLALAAALVVVSFIVWMVR